MTIDDELQIKDNRIFNSEGLLVVTMSDKLHVETIRIYASIFALSFELLRFMDERIDSILNEYGLLRQDETTFVSGYIPYPTQNLPEWVVNGIKTISFANGASDERPNENYLLNVDPRPLSIYEDLLKNDFGETVSILSKKMDKSAVQSYARLFVASVDLYRILDYKSKKQMDELKEEYESAQDFNKQNKLPKNVVILADNPPFMPDELREERELVARARGRSYCLWD